MNNASTMPRPAAKATGAATCTCMPSARLFLSPSLSLSHSRALTLPQFGMVYG